MALKITLKPGEKIWIAGAAVTNGNTTSHLMIKNTVPILREKDILKEKPLSPAHRIYSAVQLMYLDRENLATYHDTYWNLVNDFLDAAPSALPQVDTISRLILSSNYYKALKAVRALIDFEKKLLSRA